MKADHNPFLKPWDLGRRSSDAQKGAIERPERIENVPWQTRAAPPTEYENRLGDALEAAFAAGIERLEDIVVRLNTQGLFTATGERWTEAGFEAEMRRLAGPDHRSDPA